MRNNSRYIPEDPPGPAAPPSFNEIHFSSSSAYSMYVCFCVCVCVSMGGEGGTETLGIGKKRVSWIGEGGGMG